MGRDKRQGNELTAKVLAAALTPLAADGESVDLSAVEAYCHYLADGSVDGAFILGTTGEGMLLTNPERKLVTEAFVAAAGGTMDVVAHCGAQTTAATVDLAAHAVRSGATATAVIPPPYFTLTDVELLEHLTAAARASEPLPFYVYQFEARSGYATPISVIERLQASCENLGGIKVSDTPYAKFERYLDCGIDVLVGPEEFIPRAFARGAVGAVSGLASAYPSFVAELARCPSDDTGKRARSLREVLSKRPFQASAKAYLHAIGVPIQPFLRRPLLPLSRDETKALIQDLEAWSIGGRGR